MTKKKVTRADMLEMFDRLEERTKEREGKIAAYLEKFRKYRHIFLYGAGTDAKFIAGLLKDTLMDKEVCFIDTNKQKHGIEVVPGIFCRSIETVYGYGEEAIIIITSSLYANDIEYQLMGEEYQTSDRLLGTPICAEFVLLLARNKEIESCLIQKDKVLLDFDLVDNEKDRRGIYYGLHGLWRGLSYREYDPDEFMPPEDETFSDFLQGFLSEHLPEGKGHFVLCSAFSKDKIAHLKKAGKDRIDTLYAFELNRLYIPHELTRQMGENVQVINACLGEKDFRLTKEMRGNGMSIYDWLDFCSDEFAEVMSLDEMIATGKIKGRIHCVRLTIGNGTGSAIRGMREMLGRDKPILIMQPGGHWSLPDETLHSIIAYLHYLVPEYKVFTKWHMPEKLDGGGNVYLYV